MHPPSSPPVLSEMYPIQRRRRPGRSPGSSPCTPSSDSHFSWLNHAARAEHVRASGTVLAAGRFAARRSTGRRFCPTFTRQPGDRGIRGVFLYAAAEQRRSCSVAARAWAGLRAARRPRHVAPWGICDSRGGEAGCSSKDTHGPLFLAVDFRRHRFSQAAQPTRRKPNSWLSAPRKVYSDTTSFFLRSTDPEKVDTGEVLEVAGRLSPVLLCRSDIVGFADALGLKLVEHEPLLEENRALRAHIEELERDLDRRSGSTFSLFATGKIVVRDFSA